MTDEEVAEHIAKRAVSGELSEGQIQYEIAEALAAARKPKRKTVFRATADDFPKKETLGDA